MFLLPLFFGFMFVLTLVFKLIGGKIASWVIILLGLLFVVPLSVFLIYVLINKFRAQR